MTTPAEYRDFADQCLLWADQANDAGQREILVGIARIWSVNAIIADQYVTLAGDSPARWRELRDKLN